MRHESWNNPLPDNASLSHVSVATSQKTHLLGNGQQWDIRCLVAVIYREVQQTVTTDTRCESLRGGDFSTVRPRAVCQKRETEN
jgi:hypothetical protein